MLLLVTNRRDITVDYVVAELKRRQTSFFRLNTEELSTARCTMTAFPRNAWSLSFEGPVLQGSDVKAAYFRRPAPPLLATSASPITANGSTRKQNGAPS